MIHDNDLKFEISIAKKLITKHLNIKYGSVNSSIEVKSITAKWAIFDTNLNGLKQFDKKVPLIDAPKFLKYYREQIEIADSVDLEEIDLENQSIEFLTQYDNLGVSQNEIYEVMTTNLKKFLPYAKLEMLFLEDSIKYVISNNYIKTHIRKGKVLVTNQYRDDVAINGEDNAFYMGVVIKLLNSVDQNELLNFYNSYFSQKQQLKKLYRESDSDYVFDQIDFVEWLDLGSEGVYKLPLNVVSGYVRTLEVTRETKKTHTVKIICNNSLGETINEYETEFLKVAQDNGEIKESIHKILKYGN